MKYLMAAMSLVFCAGQAHSEVIHSAPDGFELSLERESPIAATQQFARLMKVSQWWSDAHTYSGDAGNLMITSPSVGGVWKERWAEGEVQHGHIIAGSRVDGNWMVRFDAPLGPLQAMGVKAILTIDITPVEETTSRVKFTYVVTGASFQGLDALAPAVDGVLTEQIDNLVAVPVAAEIPQSPE